MWRKSGLICLALLCALLLAFSPVTSYSQSLGPTPPPSSGLTTQQQQQRLAELMQTLVTLRLLSIQLGSDLQAWPQQINDLQTNLQQLSQQLKDSNASLQDSEAAQLQMQDALDRSQASLIELSKSLQNYKDSAAKVQADLQQQVAQERASKLKFEVAAGIGAAVVVGIAGYAGGHALHIW